MSYHVSAVAKGQVAILRSRGITWRPMPMGSAEVNQQATDSAIFVRSLDGMLHLLQT